jgi:hypothetical protein
VSLRALSTPALTDGDADDPLGERGDGRLRNSSLG